MDDQANIDFIKQFYDAYLKGDRERLLSFMAPDIEWDIPSMPGIPFSGTRHGREQVNEFFRLVGESQQLVRFEPREFMSTCDRVVVVGHNDWTVKSTRAGFGSDWVHIFTLRDKLVAGGIFWWSMLRGRVRADRPAGRDRRPRRPGRGGSSRSGARSRPRSGSAAAGCRWC